jgi:hypothetical protein
MDFQHIISQIIIFTFAYSILVALSGFIFNLPEIIEMVSSLLSRKKKEK